MTQSSLLKHVRLFSNFAVFSIENMLHAHAVLGIASEEVGYTHIMEIFTWTSLKFSYT